MKTELKQRMNKVSSRSLDGNVVMAMAEWNAIVNLVSNLLSAPVASSQEIDRLTKCLAKANEQAEHFEREWYLRGDIIEQLRDAEQWHEEEKEKLAQWMISRSIATGHGDTISDLIAALESHDPVASVPQDVEEFISARTLKIEPFQEPVFVCTPDVFRAWMAGHARVPVDVLETILEVVRGKLNEAYQNAMPVCCKKAGQECCGNPVAEWNPSDIELMDSLGPVEKTISAMLTASKERTE